MSFRGKVIVAVVLGCAAFWAIVGLAIARADAPNINQPSSVVQVPWSKFNRAVAGWRAERAKVAALRRTLSTSPDFRVSLQLAGIVYGQDWRHLERCALSEGARRSENGQRFNYRHNASGSGAFSSFQFMRGTFLSTPFAALDWSRQDVQAFAAGWMWSQGRRSEWAGTGC